MDWWHGGLLRDLIKKTWRLLIFADADAKDKDLSVELSPVLRPGYHVVTQEIKITEPNEVGEAGDHPVKTRYSNLFSVIRGDCNEDGEIDPQVEMIPIRRVK